MKQKKQYKNYTAPALDKGLDILELLSENQEGLTQAQIADRLNKSVNEIYRMISTLRNREYVDFDEDEDRYNLSYKILNMTAKFEPVKTLINKAIPIMKEIAIKANQSVHLAIYTRGKILIIAQEDSPSSFNYHVSVGATFDLLETSSGRVILTFQEEKERKRRLERRRFFKRFEPTSKIPIKQLKEIEKKFSKNTMKKIYKEGYELVKSLQIKGVTNISVPIFDYTGNAIATLTTPFVDRIISKGELKLEEVMNLLKDSGKILSSDMGYKKKKNMNTNNFTERLNKCYTGVIHDIMRDDGHKNFTLPSSIRPCKENFVLAGQIFTMEGEVDTTLDHHETLLAWTGFLSKAPSNKVIICQPNNNEVALMGELSAETLQLKGVRGYIVDGGARDLDFILKINFPVWSSFYTPRDVVGYWKPTKFEQPIKIGNTIINNNDYVLADIDGVVIIPANIIEDILIRAEKLINTENLVRKSIKEGMDPQEAYLKYSAF